MGVAPFRGSFIGIWIFSFHDETTAGTWIAVIAAIAIILTSSMTNYEGGFLGHAISMRMHLMTDALVGIFLVISPWIFGFATSARTRGCRSS